MRIVGLGPGSPHPFVPDFVLRDDGERIGKGGMQSEGLVVPLPGAVLIPDGSWVGVRGDGAVEIFPESDEVSWRAQEAHRCVLACSDGSVRDPVLAIELLHGAAALVGLRVPDLVRSLSEARAPGETLEATFDRVKKPKG
jgi:hypothetical protein